MSFVKTYIDSRGLISEQTDTQPSYALEIRGAVSSSVFGSTQPKIYSYVVGNALAGDTQYNCDFLDPGDGTGLERALAAATVSASVYVRPGTITLDQNRIHLPLVLSQSCRLIGSGPLLTKILSNSGSATISQHVLHMSESSELSDIYFKIVPQVGNTPSTYLGNIYYDAWCKIKNVEIDSIGNPLSAQVDNISTVFYYWPPSKIPDGVVFKDIKITYSGTINSNNYPQTFYLYIESASYREPSVRPLFENISIIGDPDTTVQGIYTTIPSIDVENLYIKNSYTNVWIRPNESNAYPSIIKGPKINNSTFDSLNINTPDNAAANVQITINNRLTSSSKVINTSITNCTMNGNQNIDGTGINVYFETNNHRWLFENVLIDNCEDICSTQYAGGVGLYSFSSFASQSYAFNNVSITNCSSVSGTVGVFPVTNISMSNITLNNVKTYYLAVFANPSDTKILLTKFKILGCDASMTTLTEREAGSFRNLIYLGNRAGSLTSNLTSILSGSATSNYIGA